MKYNVSFSLYMMKTLWNILIPGGATGPNCHITDYWLMVFIQTLNIEKETYLILTIIKSLLGNPSFKAWVGITMISIESSTKTGPEK